MIFRRWREQRRRQLRRQRRRRQQQQSPSGSSSGNDGSTSSGSKHNNSDPTARIERRYQTIEKWLVSKKVTECSVDVCLPVMTALERGSSSSHDGGSVVGGGSTQKKLRDNNNQDDDEYYQQFDERPSATKIMTRRTMSTDTLATEACTSDDVSSSSSSSDVSSLDCDQECPICMEPFSVDDTVSWSFGSSACRHVFHHACIKEWLVRHSQCPVCRCTLLPVDDISKTKKKKIMSTSTAKKVRDLAFVHQQQSSACYYCVQHGVVQLPKRFDRCVTSEELSFIKTQACCVPSAYELESMRGGGGGGDGITAASAAAAGGVGNYNIQEEEEEEKDDDDNDESISSPPPDEVPVSHNTCSTRNGIDNHDETSSSRVNYDTNMDEKQGVEAADTHVENVELPSTSSGNVPSTVNEEELKRLPDEETGDT